MISAGRTITFAVAGDTGQWVPRTVADVRKDVIDALSPSFDVITLMINRTGGFSDDPINLYYWEWPYTAELTARPRSDYGDIRDVDALVAHAFYLAGGQMPTVTATSEGEAPQDNAETEPPGIGSLIKWAVIGAIALAVIVVIERVPR